MGCINLINGLDVSCKKVGRYYQNAVLMNLSEKNQVAIYSNASENSVMFNLKEGSTGYLFQCSEKLDFISGTFSKSEEDGNPVYNHSVKIIISGINESDKATLKQIDSSNLFAALQYNDGMVEIFGFESGLRSNSYTYDANGGIGGAVITLASKFSEYDPPYIYKTIGNVGEDFDNLFANIPDFLVGDFDDDFNADFYNLGS